MKLRDYQLECLNNIEKDIDDGYKKLLCCAPTGCLTGDTIISFNRAGKGFKKTIEKAYISYNRLGNYKWDRNKPTRVRSLIGDRVGLHEIDDIVYSGIKQVYKIELECGKSIKATKCHKFIRDSRWIKLKSLNIGDSIMVELSDKPISYLNYKPKQSINYLEVPKEHPYCGFVVCKGRATYRLPEHRLIYECSLNKLSLKEFKKKIKEKDSNLKFVNPNIYHIHHIDFNYKNNNVNNLLCLKKEDHFKIHGDYRNFNQGKTSYSKIKSIIKLGKEKTYDICCKAPYHNFIANGIVVHNSGKTLIFGALIQNYLKNNPDKKVVILSHLSLLTNQTRQRFKKDWNIETDILQAEKMPSRKARCIISTMQSFRNEDKIDSWANSLKTWATSSKESLNIGLIIIDEVHYIGCQSYDTILDMFPNVTMIGFTATPIRENKLITNLFNKTSYNISTKELIDRGYLVTPELSMIEVNTLDQEELYTTIVNVYKTQHKRQKAVVYLKTIDECNTLANIFDMNGVRCRAITSNITGDSRDIILTSFKEDEDDSPDVLTTVNVLTAGFDSPNLEIIFMPYKVSSVTTYIQRVGRGLRLCPEINKKKCIVYATSKSPKIEKGEWERLTRKALGYNQQTPNDNYLDDIDFGNISEMKVQWTREVVELAKNIRSKGLINLSEMIINKKFPEDLLNIMKDNRVSKARKLSNIMATEAQKGILKGRGLPTDGLTKQEASIVIDSVSIKENWTIPEWKKIKTGKFAGSSWDKVPYLYIKNITNPITKAEYYRYKAKLVELKGIAK